MVHKPGIQTKQERKNREQNKNETKPKHTRLQKNNMANNQYKNKPDMHHCKSETHKRCKNANRQLNTQAGDNTKVQFTQAGHTNNSSAHKRGKK